jgi:O-antigen/teichoic acid export membrane protein
VIYLYTIIALITVIGAYIITPKIGLTGAGYSWLIANIITASIAIIDLWRK